MLIPSVVCVEPNTPPEEYVEQLVELPRGRLTQVVIFIPPGHSGITGLRIRYGLEYIIPYHSEEWIRGDSVAIVDYPQFILPETTNNLIVEAYNNSSSYTHCFYLYFIVDPQIERMEDILYRIIYKLDHMIANTDYLIEKLLGKPRR